MPNPRSLRDAITVAAIVQVLCALGYLATTPHADNSTAGLYLFSPGILIGLLGGFLLDSRATVVILTVVSNTVIYSLAALVCRRAVARMRAPRTG